MESAPSLPRDTNIANSIQTAAPTGVAVAHQHWGYRPDIDGLRAIAVLAVVVTHSFGRFLPGGLAGVDVFFVISGFLISGIILREIQEEKFSIAKFYGRRVRRLFPALTVVFVFVWICGWLLLLPREFQTANRQILGGTGFSLNLLLYKDRGYPDYAPFSHLWSLGVEEQFYLFWPVFVWLVWKFAREKFIGIVLGASVISFALNLASLTTDPYAPFFLPWCRLWELSLGGLLAYTQLTGVPAPNWARTMVAEIHSRRWSNIASLAGAALLIGTFAWVNGTMNFPGWLALMPTAGALLLIAAGPDGIVNRKLLSTRPMVFIGLTSYPLYLWHFPVIILAALAAGPRLSPGILLFAIAVSFILSVLTYRYVEVPLRHSFRRGAVTKLLCAAIVAVAIVAYFSVAKVIRPRSASYEISQLEVAAAEDWWGDSSNTYWTPFVDSPVRMGIDPFRTLFVGDHQMQQYYPRLVELFKEQSGTRGGAIFLTHSWCAPALGLQKVTQFRGSCDNWVRQAIEFANDPEIDTIVLGACWSCYLTTGERSGQTLNGLEQVVSVFLRSKKRIVIVLSSPVSQRLNPRLMIRRRLFGAEPFSLRPSQISRSEIEAAIGFADGKIKALANRLGVETVFPIDTLCTGNACEVFNSQGEPLYHGGYTLAPSYVRDNVSFLDFIIRDPSGLVNSAPGSLRGLGESQKPD